MIKQQLLELIRRQSVQNGLGTTDDSKRVSLRQVELAVGNMYADVLQMLIKNEADFDFFAKPYYDIDIQYDRTKNEYFSDIPIKIVQLAGNNGVVMIKGSGSNRKFYKSTNTTIDLHTDTDVSKYYDRTLYIMDGNTKVRYVSFDYGSHNIRKVNMRLIPDFSEYAMTDDVILPSGRITDFVNLVAKQLFQQKRQLDSSSDSNPT